MNKFKTGSEIFKEMYLPLNNSQYMLTKELAEKEYISKEDLNNKKIRTIIKKTLDERNPILSTNQQIADRIIQNILTELERD